MPDNNKVKYGLKNFTWWPITEITNSETGVVTTSYVTAHKIPGIVVKECLIILRTAVFCT